MRFNTALKYLCKEIGYCVQKSYYLLIKVNLSIKCTQTEAASFDIK